MAYIFQTNMAYVDLTAENLFENPTMKPSSHVSSVIAVVPQSQQFQQYSKCG
uniref:Uncharacterized protein n=1 Tax=Picea glauca TaxID=3330 RepID=A0A101LVA0_PICGL|nr:hypothetical protein ABT39_MTgene2107 [Picea glauca]QHR86931.1 hypothetical protein Q903MT_gene938 [Picea sitchensis]